MSEKADTRTVVLAADEWSIVLACLAEEIERCKTLPDQQTGLILELIHQSILQQTGVRP